jgi:hypothetical protein
MKLTEIRSYLEQTQQFPKWNSENPEERKVYMNFASIQTKYRKNLLSAKEKDEFEKFLADFKHLMTEKKVYKTYKKLVEGSDEKKTQKTVKKLNKESWLSKLSAMEEFITTHGKLPLYFEKEEKYRKLRNWLANTLDQYRNTEGIMKNEDLRVKFAEFLSKNANIVNTHKFGVKETTKRYAVYGDEFKKEVDQLILVTPRRLSENIDIANYIKERTHKFNTRDKLKWGFFAQIYESITIKKNLEYVKILKQSNKEDYLHKKLTKFANLLLHGPVHL